MRHPSGGGDLNPQRSFRGECNVVLCGFAVDQILASMCSVGRLVYGIFIGHLRAEAVAFFSNYKQQADIETLLAQSFRSCNLRGDDSLGVARSPTEDARRIF